MNQPGNPCGFATLEYLGSVIVWPFSKRESFLILRDESERSEQGLRKRFVEFVERRADSVYTQEDRKEDDAFIQKVRKTYAELTAKQEGKLSRPV